MMRVYRRISYYGAAGIVTIIATSLFLAFLSYPGSLFVFVFFNATFLLLAFLIFPRPRVYAYTFLSALLVMGFWLKTIVQTVWQIGFIEPTGDFSGTPHEWDIALTAAACGAVGTIVARLVQLAISRRGSSQVGDNGRDPVPRWYPGLERPLWILTLVLIVTLTLLNFRFALFQIGVNPKIVLPFNLNVAAAWLVSVGFSLWVATLVHWSFRVNPRSLATNLVMPMAEAFFSSVSSYSRLYYLLHTVPYWVALSERWNDYRTTLRRNAVIALSGCFIALFCLSIVMVFFLRVVNYQEIPATPHAERPLMKRVGQIMRSELPNLFVNRWIGLEGVLTVGAVPNRGLPLFMAALADDQRLGAKSLFQQAAKVRYLSNDPKRYTFLSNAGVIALLWFSGSYLMLIVGMAFISGMLLVTESLAYRCTANPLFAALGGLSLANIVSQMTFPYLSLIFLAELWVAAVFIALIQRVGSAKLATT